MIYIWLILLSIIIACNNQNQTVMNDRTSMYAGRFYEADSTDLREQLEELFFRAKPKQLYNVRAIIAPHAGYVFSGTTAASAYNQIDDNVEYENIFVIAPSHHFLHKGVALYMDGNYITPLGKLYINQELQKQWIDKYPHLFYNSKETHFKEHSLEVQLPFIQHKIKQFKFIVPVIVTTNDTSELQEIAKIFEPYFNENNLFIISNDLSHYPHAKDAEIVDYETINAVLSNKPDSLLKISKKLSDVPNLSTRLCGKNAVLLLQYITQIKTNVNYHLVEYTNSSKSKYGSKDSVVGYAAIFITEGNKSNLLPEFTEEEQKELLNIARTTLAEFLTKGEMPKVNITNNKFNKHLGAFVSLYNKDLLRGCIGTFTSDTLNKSLVQNVQEMAVAAAIRDLRFQNVEYEELDNIRIEISVISSLRKISNIKEIEIGKHGIFIRKGLKSGTFLPQVALKKNWSVEEFLGHCSKDKVGIAWDGWKDAEIYVFETFVFSE